jgi:pimeloyl-ACP methyl ester carboxylesterase
MLRKDHSLASLSDLGSWPSLKRYMADDFVGRVPRDDGYELASDHCGPVASRARLSGRYRLIAPDHLGYGRTGAYTESLPPVKHELAILDKLIEVLGGCAHLVGHSYGAALAARCAARARERPLLNADRADAVLPVETGWIAFGTPRNSRRRRSRD